jgi:hypothetical protein
MEALVVVHSYRPVMAEQPIMTWHDDLFKNVQRRGS